MRRKLLAILAVVALMVTVAACATLEKNAFNSLLIAANSYESGMGSLKDLHAKGLVSDIEKDKAVMIAEGYWSAYHSSVEALEGYKRTASVEDKDRLATALKELSEFCGDLVGYLNPILTRHGKEPVRLEPFPQ